MKSEFTGKTMVFRKDYEGRAFYSTSIGKKTQDGSYENGYIQLQFKKGVELENKTEIDIGNGWLTFYLKDKVPRWQIFVSEFEVVGGVPEGFSAVDDTTIPF